MSYESNSRTMTPAEEAAWMDMGRTGELSRHLGVRMKGTDHEYLAALQKRVERLEFGRTWEGKVVTHGRATD